MKKAGLTVLFLLGIIYFSFAQVIEPNPDDSWRKRLKAGDKLVQEGDFSSATAHYMSVLMEKPKKKDVAYKAGVNGIKARRYQDVVMALEAIKDQVKKYPKARFYYALALKGIGKYDQAAAEFDAFSNSYRGSDYQEMSEWATREMQGCSYAKANPSQDNVKISFLTKIVNSPRKEFAPIPFGQDILYFSSDAKIATKIYRTERIDRTWKDPLEPAIFGAMEKEHFCGGSFTPSKSRFYFTQCDIVEGEYKCAIYVMHRRPNSWSKPEKLPDYINSEGYTSMDPFVSVEGGKEILYFTSDREGGYGGKDLWYAIKDVGSSEMNFDIPINLGEAVNTPQDEVSPYFDEKNGAIYFSSNGHINYGGLDVFSALGTQGTWREVKNMGKPINSSADDAYFILREDLTSGFLSSNRAFGGEKTMTDNDDLFMFVMKEEEVTLEGKIHQVGNTNQIIKNVMVTVYEVTNSGEYALNSNVSPDGYYQFIVQPEKEYKITIEKDGYDTKSFDVDMSDYTEMENVSLDLPMSSPGIVDNNDIVRNEIPGNPDINDVVVVQPGDDDNGDLPPGGETDDVPPPGGDSKNKFKKNVQPGKKPTEKIPGNPDVSDNHPQREPAVVDNDPPVKPPVQPSINPSDQDNPPVDISDPTDGEPVFDDGPNEDNIIGTKHISDLSRSQKEDIEIYDGVPYLKVNGGFFKIDLKAKRDNDFPGIDGGIGSHYRIQLAAVTKYRDYKYADAKDLNLGEFVQESTTSREGKEVTRVMITAFPNFSSAKKALRRLRDAGYDRAFIIRYEDDRRVGRMIRDID